MGTRGVTPGRVLVVGLGISGMATAIRLQSLGWDVVIVERAPARRTGGYFIATMGTGQAAAKRLGIFDDLPDRNPPSTGFVDDIDRSGKARRTQALFDLPITPKPMLMLRGDVEQALFKNLPNEVEVRYSTVPVKIVQDGDGVDVTLHTSPGETDTTERFDLVVGADGLRSTVRALVFGPHEKFLRRLNYMIAAFELNTPPANLRIGDGAMLFEPGRSMIVYPFADRTPTALFSYKTDDVDAEFTQTPIERIRAVYGPPPYGRILGEVIDAFEAADNYLFDSVEQPHLDSWHRGRVVLVGDAAWCPTLYSGMGSSSGMAGGELLGTVLAEHAGCGIESALTEWEQRMRPYTDSYQKIGAQASGLFTPTNRAGILLRRATTTGRGNPVIAPLVNWALRNSSIAKVRSVDIAADSETVRA